MASADECGCGCGCGGRDAARVRVWRGRKAAADTGKAAEEKQPSVDVRAKRGDVLVLPALLPLPLPLPLRLSGVSGGRPGSVEGEEGDSAVPGRGSRLAAKSRMGPEVTTGSRYAPPTAGSRLPGGAAWRSRRGLTVLRGSTTASARARVRMELTLSDFRGLEGGACDALGLRRRARESSTTSGMAYTREGDGLNRSVTNDGAVLARNMARREPLLDEQA